MKIGNDSLTLADLSLLLHSAGVATNHRHFVIVGDHSAIGALMHTPPEMGSARNVDLFPRLDASQRTRSKLAELSDGSAFSAANGFYANAVLPQELMLPDAWEARLIQLPLEHGITAWFLEPNDAAISMLARGDTNDLRWVTAGLRAGIVKHDLAAERLQSLPVTPEHAAVVLRALEECTATAVRLGRNDI